MRLVYAILLVLLAASLNRAVCQSKAEIVQSRILILLDESSSMNEKWNGGKEKFKVARDIIMRLMDSVYFFNPDVEFSLRVFGHQHTVQENNCYDTRNEVAFSKNNATQMELRLLDIHPLGVTPIAFALQEAADKDITDVAHNAYSIILITDGGESCGGDLCNVMRTLILNKVFFIPYIVGLEDAPELKTAYQCMGNLLKVTKDDDIGKAIATIVGGYRPLLKITKEDYKQLKITAKVPSVLKVNSPEITLPVLEPLKDTPKNIPVVIPALPPVPAVSRLTVAPFLVFTIKATPNSHISPVLLPERPVFEPPIIIPATTAVRSLNLAAYNIPAFAGSAPSAIQMARVPSVPLEQPAPATVLIAKLPVAALIFPNAAPENPVALKTHEPTKVIDSITIPTPLPTVPQIRKLQPASIIDQQLPAIAQQRISGGIVPIVAQQPQPEPLPVVGKLIKLQPASLKSTVVITPEPETLPKVNVPTVRDAISFVPAPVVANISKLGAAALLQPSAKPTPVPVAVFPVPSGSDAAPLLPPPPQVSRINHLAMASAKPVSSITILQALVRTLEPPDVTDVITFNTQPSVRKISPLEPSKMKPNDPLLPSVSKMPLAKVTIPTIALTETPTLPKTEKISKLKPAKEMEPRVMFLIEDHAIRKRNVPPPPSFSPIPSPALSANKPALDPSNSKPPGNNSTYTVETEDAKETTVMIYFTDGHGKFYFTTPPVMLVEPGTNIVKHKFYRTVGPDGNPDPQKNIKEGVYNIAISEKRNLTLYNVEIMPGKVNKVFVKLKRCSLVFAYENAPDRPVSEFDAVVIQRNVPNGRVVRQKGTQKLEYEPGNYHIDIETYPTDRRNLDLEFDEIKEVQIQQPGFVKFTTEMKNGTLNLFKAVGDKFLQFDARNVNDTAMHHLRIQPGQYQVHYLKDPSKPYAKETVISFAVKPTQETVVELPVK
jgi:von Willebrand factor type A domain